jgi:hypothetical protein
MEKLGSASQLRALTSRCRTDGPLAPTTLWPASSRPGSTRPAPSAALAQSSVEQPDLRSTAPTNGWARRLTPSSSPGPAAFPTLTRVRSRTSRLPTLAREARSASSCVQISFSWPPNQEVQFSPWVPLLGVELSVRTEAITTSPRRRAMYSIASSTLRRSTRAPARWWRRRYRIEHVENRKITVCPTTPGNARS